MRIPRVFAATVVCLAMIVTAFAGLAEKGTSASTLNPDTFVDVTIGEPMSIDPATDWEDNGWNVLQNVYETLVWYDGASINLVPLLGTEVPTLENGLISPDGMEYTFHLSAGILFHDGTTMNADDVVYSIARVLRMHDINGMGWALDQTMLDYLSMYLGNSVGAYLADSHGAMWISDILLPLGEDHIITEDDLTEVAEASVVKVDDMTVMLRLAYPYAGFLQILATPVASIVSMEWVEANGGVVNGQWNDYVSTHECGSGPYMLVDWTFGSKITLIRFDGYHGPRPALKTVQILNVGDVSVRLTMIKSGDADTIYLPPRYESEVAGSPDIYVVKGFPDFEISFVQFNMHINSAEVNAQYGTTITDDFFTDVHVRRAFSHIIDSASFIQNSMNGNAMTLNGPIPMGMFGYDASIPAYVYDLEQAKAELQLATNPSTGNSWWTDGFSIPLFYNVGNAKRQAVMEQIKASLELLNPLISATVIGLDWPTYADQLYSSYSMFPLVMTGWTQDYADPDDFVSPMFDSTYWWYTTFSGYFNPEIDSLVKQAASELDPTLRASTYSQLTLIIHDDVPYVWISQSLSFFVQRTWVNGYYFNPMLSGLYYAALWKTAEPGIEVVKHPGSPAKSAVTYVYTPSRYGTWTGSIVNDGLRSLVVEVCDITTGVPEEVTHQKINFKSDNAYPNGEVDTRRVIMSPNHIYQITLTPNGPTGSRAVVTNQFAAIQPPIASFFWWEQGSTVFVDGTSSFDFDGNIVAWMWDWGDGAAGEGSTASHTYGMSGEYSITLTVTDDSGLTGTTSQLIYVYGGAATLSGPHGDHGLDSDGDGSYDFLVLDVSIQASVAGNYSLYVNLYDPAMNFVTWSYASYYVGQGHNTVAVPLEGLAIMLSGLNGPYTAYIDLYDQLGYWLGSDTHVTQMYTCDQFGLLPAEFAPPHSDHGLDTDGDGLYDYLVVDVVVSVVTAGAYTVNSTLYDSSSEVVNWVSVNEYLETGVQTVQVAFKGHTIRNSGSDGQFQVSLRLQASSGLGLDSDTYITQWYSWNQFQHPIAEFAPPHIDHGMDTNSDGLFEYLAIDVSLSVSVAGTYTISASLYDSWYGTGYVGWCVVSPALGTGLQTVQILIPGYMVHNSGINGPYWALLSMGGPDGYWLQNSEHYTQAYLWNQFQPSIT